MLQGLGLPLLWPLSFPTGPSEARGRSTHGGGELCLGLQPFAKTCFSSTFTWICSSCGVGPFIGGPQGQGGLKELTHK